MAWLLNIEELQGIVVWMVMEGKTTIPSSICNCCASFTLCLKDLNLQ